MAVDVHAETGRAALRIGRWEEARVAFERSSTKGWTAAALDGMAEALWWLCESRESVRYRERAFVAFRRTGDPVRACQAAVNLCIAYLVNLGNEAAARGWLARAERVTQGMESNPVEGWLWLMHGFLATDPERSRDFLARALDHARESGDSDLELVALADLGMAFVISGDPEDGMRMLDEAMAGTLAGEYSRLDTVVYTSCNMLAACSLVGDLERASQWCRVADDFMKDYSCPFLFARCRVHYGSVLVAKGQWERAEDELRLALHMSEDAGPGPQAEALARLADLRFRQGRVEEAQALLADLDDPVSSPIPEATIHLARGEPSTAVALLERHLELVGENHFEATSILAMLVQAHVANGYLDAAGKVALRLDRLAEARGSGHPLALSALAAAHISIAKDQPDDAIGHLEDALKRFVRLDLPYEIARVRILLAGALAESRPELAVAEARRALAVFADLGASADSDAAASLLRSLGVASKPGPRHVGALTKREQEVLQLVGLGLSNPEIAQRLYISRKTAAHHVSNLLAKLGLRNRAEAVAHATRSVEPPPS